VPDNEGYQLEELDQVFEAGLLIIWDEVKTRVLVRVWEIVELRFIVWDAVGVLVCVLVGVWDVELQVTELERDLEGDGDTGLLPVREGVGVPELVRVGEGLPLTLLVELGELVQELDADFDLDCDPVRDSDMEAEALDERDKVLLEVGEAKLLIVWDEVRVVVRVLVKVWDVVGLRVPDLDSVPEGEGELELLGEGDEPLDDDGEGRVILRLCVWSICCNVEEYETKESDLRYNEKLWRHTYDCVVG
jgi:hypothetical protein